MLNPTPFLQPYKGCKIAVYGLSLLTEELLPCINQECQVVGLLDGYRTDGILYGKPIISIDTAIEQNIKLILVAARPESCKIIAKRIEAVCREHQIDLLDYKGKNLLEQTVKLFAFANAAGATKKQLIQAIHQHDVVSMDLFDTLLMRQTLFPTDVFELVDFRLRQQGIIIDELPKKRLEAEKELCKNTVPTLTEIYTYIKRNYEIPALCPAEAAELEWQIDSDLLVPRRELCDLLQTVYQQGKPVYIVTDTFYRKDEIRRFLDKYGIKCFTDVLTSCDYRTSKTQKLFQHLRKKFPGKTCIHIGDSEDADGKAAEKNGLTGLRIFSGLDLMEQVGYLGVLNAVRGLSSRIQAGMFVSRLFNSPFQFEEEHTKITVQHASDIAFLFFAPIITCFMFWFHQKVQENDLKNVWFCARDGYLIKKLYDFLDDTISSVYFLTSRTAAIRAGMETREDIQYVEEMRFSGTLQEQLKHRFDIAVPPSNKKGRLADYEQEILEKAVACRKNCRAYLDQLEIAEGPIAFFDFVARGTTQMYISRLIEHPLKGFYFLQQDTVYMQKNGLDILSFYQNNDTTTSVIAENYYILEILLTSPMPSLNGFDSQGLPLYAKEIRTESALRCIQAMQDSIQEYFQTYWKLYPKAPESRELSELFLPFVHNIAIADRDFLDLKVEDPFFNRSTNLADLL